MHLINRIFRPPQRTPSLEYKPKTKDDKQVAGYYQNIRAHHNRTNTIHPDMPLGPAGSRAMTPDEAAATRIFKDQHDRVPDTQVEYMQTYRREGDEIVANQQGLIQGERTRVGGVSGLYPPGSRIDIHSHPDVHKLTNSIPSDLDYLHAHHARTNKLHRPGTEMDGAIMYYPPTQTFFGYTGERVGPQRRPEFLELRDPFPSQGMDPNRAPIDRMRVPDGSLPPAPGSVPAAHGGSPFNQPGTSNAPGTLEWAGGAGAAPYDSQDYLPPRSASPSPSVSSSMAGEYGHSGQPEDTRNKSLPSLPDA
jgi:hypothetical protein